MKYGSKGDYILGITASSRRVVGVLVHDAADGPVIIRTFVRKRAGANFMSSGPSSGIEFDAANGSTLEIGEPTSDAALFLDSEFHDPDLKPEDLASTEYTGSVHAAVPFEMELLDIVSECEDAGYPSPRIVFTLLSDHLFAVPVDSSADDQPTDGRKKAKKKKKGEISTEKLIELASADFEGKIEPSKATFLPMFAEKPGDATHLGIFAQATDPVHLSLESIRERKRSFPYVSLLDTEFSLLYGLVRASRLMPSVQTEDAENGQEPMVAPVWEAQEKETTLLIRVGPDDTVVMFMVGDRLLHFESLRSITAFDPPETICSRILLLQDELGSGDAHRLVVFSDDREEALIANLQEFFPDTFISSLRSTLPAITEERTKPLGKESILAAAAALRMVKDPLYQQAFPEVDFLNPKLKGRTLQLPFSWSVAAMIVLLFCSTLFFVSRYFYQSYQLDLARTKLELYPGKPVTSDADALQARIDSLQAVSNGYVRALDLLDSLLVGSDKWSRALEKTAIHTAETQGIWIDQWHEEDGRLMLVGAATDRDQIVAFASSIGAIIGQQSFSSIREWPVYTFNMSLPMTEELPEAALYLRKRARTAGTDFSEAMPGEALSETSDT